MIRSSLLAAAAALALAGAAHAQGTATANTGVTIQNQAISVGGGAGSGAANGGLHYGGSFRQDQNVPAPNLSTFTTNPCTLPQGIAGGAMGVSVGVMATFLDEGCDARADAAAWRGLGFVQVGVARMRQREANERAWREAMTGVQPAPIPTPPLTRVEPTPGNTQYVPVPMSGGAMPAAANANAAIAERARPAAAPIYDGNCWDRAQRLDPRRPGCRRL